MRSLLASEADLVDYTGGRVTAGDPRIEAALAGVSAAVRAWCGWHIFPQVTETVVVDGPGGSYLALPTKNVTAVTSIVETGVTLTPGSQYKWAADGSVRRVGHSWTEDYRDIAVTYTHGFGDIADLKTVVLAVTARQLASPMGATMESVGGVSIRWSETTKGVSGGLGILAHEYDLIAPYRIEWA